MSIFDNVDLKTSIKNNLLIGIIVNILVFIFARESIEVSIIVSVVYIIVIAIRDFRRVRSISKFVTQVDNILLGKDSINLSQFKEGELSLLQNKVTKLTIMLREKSELLQKEKLLLVDSIADISHQIRTPLTALNIVLESMKKQDVDSAKHRTYCREMTSILKRIDVLIMSLLKIAKLDADTVQFNKEYIEFDTMINKIMDILAIPMELKEQELVKDISGGFYGDLNWTIEAVSNIMKNCHEHMDIGGKLYVTTSENPIYSEIIIRDDGKGIDKDDLPHLFERFYKGKNSGEQSVGIGLALAKMIVVKQNGVITAANYPEGGAIFNIKLYKQNV
jgi:signal transduction histidine kinase